MKSVLYTTKVVSSLGQLITGEAQDITVNYNLEVKICTFVFYFLKLPFALIMIHRLIFLDKLNPILNTFNVDI